MKLASIVTRCSLSLLVGALSVKLYADGGGSSNRNSTPLPDNIPTMVESGQYDNAIAALSEFISDEKRNADAWNYLGYSQRKVGLFDESLRSYKKALRLDKKHLGAHEYIGELYLTLDDPKNARKHLDWLSEYCGDCEQFHDLEEEIMKYEQGT